MGRRLTAQQFITLPYALEREEPGGFDGLHVVRIVRLGPGRAEERYAVPDLRKIVEAPDVLTHDAQHAPGIADAERVGPQALLQRGEPLEKQFVFGRRAAGDDGRWNRLFSAHASGTPGGPDDHRARCKSMARPVHAPDVRRR